MENGAFQALQELRYGEALALHVMFDRFRLSKHLLPQVLRLMFVGQIVGLELLGAYLIWLDMIILLLTLQGGKADALYATIFSLLVRIESL